MGFDLADAYQQVPNSPHQRRRFVFEVGGLFFVWLVGMFGIATMAAVFGQLCDVLCWRIEKTLPSLTARHFADDHLILHDGNDPPPTTEAVYSVVRGFGWRVHETKHFSWSRRFILLGFDWDMDTQRVHLTDEKRDKYLRKLNDLSRQPTVRFPEVSSVLGTLVHVCAIFPERRAGLNALYALRERFHRSNRWHRLDIPSAVAAELRDWTAFLKQPHLSSSFRLPEVSYPHLVYSDASDLGCGVVIDGKAQQWLLPGMIEKDGVDIGVMEAWALQLALAASIALGAVDCITRFQVDNLGVVYAFRKGRSRSKWTNKCLHCIAEMAMAAGVTMSITYVPSAENLADAPSRGDCSSYQPLALDLAVPWQEFLGAAPSL
ncbi:hypothetical protein CF326_g7852 [Tilletia indica]|nr:hypothetical protein CF326_g7852 [Tilletia indica]